MYSLSRVLRVSAKRTVTLSPYSTKRLFVLLKKSLLFSEEELESLLCRPGGCDFAALRKITRNRPLPETVRPKAWVVLLGVANKPDPFSGWDQLYDLPDQASLRAQCQSIVGELV